MIAPYKIALKSDAAVPAALVTVSDLKGYLRIRAGETSEDGLIGHLEKSARGYIESRARVVLTPTVFVLQSPFPTQMESGDLMVFLPRSPVRSVDSVKIRRSGSQVTLSAGVGYSDWSTPPTPAIRLIESTGDFDGTKADAIEVVFTAGFDTTEPGRFPVPAQLRTALLALVGFWYENRGSGSIPDWIDDLIDSGSIGQ
jgi:uncharacterized phiE125 gp8 family phage protein